MRTIKVALSDERSGNPSFNIDRKFFNDHPDRTYSLRKITVDEQANLDGGSSDLTYTVIKRAKHGRLKACIELLRHLDNTEDNARTVWNMAREKYPKLFKLHNELEPVLNRK